MKIDSLIKLMLPRDKFFFEMIEKSSDNLLAAASEFIKFSTASKQNGFIELSRKIKDFEHEGDKITYKIFEELNRNFLTPLDREDIRDLTSALDDVLDIIDSIASRIVLYKVESMSNDMRGLLEVILKSVEQLHIAVKRLRKIHQNKDLRLIFEEIHKLEEDGDKIYHEGIARLFEKERDPITLIKQKEILEALERTTDRCKFAGNVIETVFMKNS